MDLSELKQSHGRKLLIDYLSEEFGDAGLIDKFDKLTEIYLSVNDVINISAIRDLDGIYIKHYLDSIMPYKYFEGRVCDVGCGGGFPCLPLAVVTNHTYLGIDGVGKKLTLIDRCANELGLTNISAKHIRAEDLCKTEKFDTVCARALSDIDKAIAFCAPLLKPNGKLLLYKTQTDERASKSTEAKHKVKLELVKDYHIFGTDIARRLFVYVK